MKLFCLLSLKHKKMNENFQKEQCVICMDTIGLENNTILSCGHKFHATCFAENVLNSNNSCPLCRIVICKEAPITPKLTKTMSASFMEFMLNTETGKEQIKSYLIKIGEKANNSWKTKEREEQFQICRETIKLLMGFGFNLGHMINKWIQQGNSRYQEEYDYDFSVQVDIDHIVDIINSHYETLEENSSSIQSFNDKSVETIEENEETIKNKQRKLEAGTIEFLYYYQLEEFLPRVIKNNVLDYNVKDYLNLTLQDIMYPKTYTRIQPLFTVNEATIILASISNYVNTFIGNIQQNIS